MRNLKQVIHYPDTNSVEATWTDVNGEAIKCHSYADCQMAMLRSDVSEFGGDISEHEEMIALVESNIKPVVPTPVPVPQILTNYQGKVTLDAFQMYEEVEAYMQLDTTARAAKLAWATGAFERQGSLIISLASDFGITDEQLDAMFIYGSQIQ